MQKEKHQDFYPFFFAELMCVLFEEVFGRGEWGLFLAWVSILSWLERNRIQVLEYLYSALFRSHPCKEWRWYTLIAAKYLLLKTVKIVNRFFKAFGSYSKNYLLGIWKADGWVLFVGIDSYKDFVKRSNNYISHLFGGGWGRNSWQLRQIFKFVSSLHVICRMLKRVHWWIWK